MTTPILLWIGFLLAGGSGPDDGNAKKQPSLWDPLKEHEVRVGVSDSKALNDTVPVWSISEDPTSVIGSTEGAEEDVLYNVFGAKFLSDGTVVVALFSRGYFEVRYFSPNGSFLNKVGRFGPGPFEVEGVGLRGMGVLPGDSVLLVSANNTFNVFGPRGEKVESGRLDLGEPFHRAHVLDRDHIVFEKWGRGTVSPGRAGSELAEFFLFELNSGGLSKITELPVADVHLPSSGRGANAVPFSPRGYAVQGRGCLWFGHAGDNDVRRFCADPIRTSSLHLSGPRRAVTRADISLFREVDVQGLEGDRVRRQREFHREVAYPDSLPHFQGLLADGEDELWVLRYEPRWSEEPFRWDVYDSGKGLIATVEIPFKAMDPCIRNRPMGPCARVLEVSGNVLMIEDHDDLGVPRLVLYQLRRSGSETDQR